MHKKLIISGLFFLSMWSSLSASQEMMIYGNIIAHEYNKMRKGVNRYSSMHAIMTQSLRGKSPERRVEILTDLRTLKEAVHIARNYAIYNGTKLWYTLYLSRDNQPLIDMLTQYENDVTDRLRKLTWESQSDMTKVLWYSSKYSAILLAGIAIGMGSLYISQGYLPDRKPPYSFIEILSTPAYAAIYGINKSQATKLN